MSADMAGPGGRSGFGWSPRDGDRRSPLKGENRKVLSGGGIVDLTDRSVPYEPDPVAPDQVVAPVPVVRRSRARWSWLRRRRRRA